MLSKTQEEINLKEFKEKVINDYRTVSLSREISIMGRRDVLSGKGKFGIFGDGKELPQVVLSHFFKNQFHSVFGDVSKRAKKCLSLVGLKNIF